jgi:hypothetical protein
MFFSWLFRAAMEKIEIVMEIIRKLGFSTVLFFMVGFCLQPTPATALVFTINSAESVVSASGLIAHFAMTPQGSGALTTSYSGNINASLSGSTIQFTGGSSIIAQTNGVWQPAVGGGSGSAPADYGPEASVDEPPFGFYTVYGALRNVLFDVTSPVIPITSGSFNGTNLVFSFVTNTATFDYYSSILSGSQNLNGYSTNTIASGATVSTNAGVRTLTIQINTQYVFKLVSANDSSVTLTGQLVATNVIATPAPVIQSFTINGQNVVATTGNTTAQSQLQVSTDLTTWLPASATVTTNGSGMIVFTSPIGGLHAFYRVLQ